MIGGTNSAVNTIPQDATAYPHRSSTLLIQSAAEPINLSDPFPQEGFDFVECMLTINSRIYYIYVLLHHQTP